MQLVATKSFTYADKPLRPGDRFTASAEDARLLKGWEKAIDAPVGATPTQTKVLSSEGETQPRKSRGRYGRRDMRAEE